jgi:GT2 family glycosyltransferase
MNILFYVNPLTEIQRPSQKTVWVTDWIPRIANAFRRGGEQCRISAVVSADVHAFLDGINTAADDFCVLSQRDMLDGYRFDGNREIRNWQEGNEDSAYSQYLADLLKKRLPADYRPDLVFSFSPAPFFEQLFRGVPVLYYEYGCFSRAPYPETFYLDPWGKGLRAFNSRYADQINSVAARQEDVEKLNEYRTRILNCLSSVPEAAAFFGELRQQYRTIFLVPLGYSNFYETDAFSKYATQFEFVEHIMDSVGDDVGVLVTQHPVCKSINDNSLDELKRLHPNLISDIISSRVEGFSQIALAYVDGAITQSSTVGLQAAFLNRYFVSVGSYFSGLADCCSLSGISDMLKNEVRNKDNFFVWNLTHYSIPAQLFSRLAPEHIRMVAELRDLPVQEALRKWRRFPGNVFDEVYLPHVKEMAGKYHPAVNMPTSETERQITELREKLQNTQSQLEDMSIRCEQLRQSHDEFQAMKQSVSFFIGRAVTWPLRTVCDGLRCWRRNGLVYTCGRIPVKTRIAFQRLNDFLLSRRILKTLFFPMLFMGKLFIMILKTIRSIRENGLRFTLKKIASFFRKERGPGWIFDTDKYNQVSIPEPIRSEVVSSGKTTVIVPVYNGLNHLKRLMPSLLANTPAGVSILLIDDCSPDEEIAPFLHAQAEPDSRVTLLKNPENRGFVKTVNHAFELCKDQDYIILLNTDTEVPPQWVERLLAPFEQNDVASVTPFSNGATIFSLPLTDDRNNRDFIRVFPLEEIDREIRKCSLPPDARTAPCGVGFCMAMKNELIRKFGGFDEKSFGRGFGEEVDWCRRAAEHGFRNVIAPNLFVSHYHGGSFDSAERQALLEEHEKLQLKKHPDYHAVLAQHDLETAPVWDIIRCAATLGLILKPEHEPVLILDHDWGGGANSYREKMIRELLSEGKAVLLAQPEVGFIRITAYYRDLRYSYPVRDFAALHLPCFSGIRRIVINELISWAYIYGKRAFSVDLYRKIAEEILVLKEKNAATLEYMVHDYFLICPHLNLVGINRTYCNPGRSAAACAGCITVRRHYEKMERYTGTITGEQWRDAMRPLLKSLDEIRFFSQNSIDIFRQVYDLEERQIRLIPHNPIIPFKPMRFSRGPVRIGCVGAIGEVKGADFIVKLANHLKAHAPDAKIVVIGIIDAKSLPDNVIVHGKYELPDLPALLDRYRVNIGFISSIWPETFSYVSQELMMLNLPLVCFDIGAPRDRIGQWRRGRIIPEMTPESAWTTISQLYRACYQDKHHA